MADVTRCKSHLEDDSCQLLFPSGFICVGENNCTHHQLNAERLCPSCNNKGASWSGYGKHGGFNYTCWGCGYIWTELLTWPKTPGICRRCGREYDSPVPEATHSHEYANHEIASAEWWADCNAFAMSVLFRESSAYRPEEKGELRDPTRGGIMHAD